MSDEINEDLIEATIRKVAAARAAREQAEPEEAAPERPHEPAQEPAYAEDSPGADEPAEDGLTAAESAPDADEDPIEATIRRVAAERAAREAAAARDDAPPPDDQPAADPAPAVPVDLPVPTPEPVEPAPEVVPQASAWAEPPDVPTVPRSSPPPRPPLALTPVAQADDAPPSDGRHTDDVASTLLRIEETLSATHEGIRTLLDRLDQVLSSTPAPASGRAPSPAPTVADDDDWDDQPQVSPLPFAAPPRPPVLRDPAPQTATAEHLVEQAHDAPVEEPPATSKPVIDTRPIPTPLPSFAAESKRGFDLLPRTYRITVEDKRRGVDLVPLHRALLGMDGVKDMSLLSYNNGVAMVALETVADIDTEVLGEAVSRAMSRSVHVEQHNEQTLVVKLAEE